MIVYPLACTKVHWPTLIEIVQSELGVSPTRGLDFLNLDLEDTASYLACLKLDNKPLESLQETGPHFSHFSISFITILTIEECEKIWELHENITIYRRFTNSKDKRIIILTGNMNEWKIAIEKYCIEKSEKILRELLNKILYILESSLFRYSFNNYTKVSLYDKTFILKRKN